MAAFIGGSAPTIRNRWDQARGDKATCCFFFQVIHPEATSGRAFARGRNQAENVAAVVADILGHGNEGTRPGATRPPAASSSRSSIPRPPAAARSRGAATRPRMSRPSSQTSWATATRGPCCPARSRPRGRRGPRPPAAFYSPRPKLQPSMKSRPRRERRSGIQPRSGRSLSDAGPGPTTQSMNPPTPPASNPRPPVRSYGRALRFSLLTAISAFAAQWASGAPDLNGAWSIDVAKPWGVTLHTFLVLRQEGGTIAGTVYPNNSGGIPVRGAHLEGSDIVFRIEWGWTFHVRPEGANLRVVVSYDGDGKDEALAYPVPEASIRAPAALPVPAVRSLSDNGLARTPPMGWNSWNHFAESVDDRIVREAADAMVSSGMAAAGYVYVNIDDTWEAGRDALGNIVPNRKFPDRKALADYVHARGLKLGIYSSPGPLTCGGYEGSYGHEEQDARTYAAWGIDYLKYDWCSAGRIYSDSELQPV